MNVDQIFSMMNQHGVRYLLIGGMNFMLRHRPLLTYDVDLWIEDTESNCRQCELALAAIDAEWGSTEENWGPVGLLQPGWLQRQAVFCLHSPQGAVDIMRAVAGMTDWQDAWQRGIDEQTKSETAYRGLSDADMLACQLALAESERRSERTSYLQKLLDDEEENS